MSLPSLSRRIPLNVFGVGFGLAGLATTWRIAVGFGLAPHQVSDVLVGLATAAWLSGLVLYARYVSSTRGALLADLNDRTVGPFAALVLITPLLLVVDGLAPYDRPFAAVLVDVLVVLVVLLGGWLTGTWMGGGTDMDRLHPGYFLPTVAGGFVASAAAAEVGQRRLAEVIFGLGAICWLIVGSMVLARLIFRPPLPDALLPTMAIEVAPAAVATVAYLFAHDGRIDAVAAGLAGYGLLMVLAQLPLLPRYLRLTFGLGTWAFAFSWTAVASAGLFWIVGLGGPETSGYSYVVLAVATALVTAIAARTVLALVRGNLLPPAPLSPALPVARTDKLSGDRLAAAKVTGEMVTDRAVVDELSGRR